MFGTELLKDVCSVHISMCDDTCLYRKYTTKCSNEALLYMLIHSKIQKNSM